MRYDGIVWKSGPPGDDYRHVLWLNAGACLALAILLYALFGSRAMLFGVGGVALFLGLAAWLFGARR